MGSIWEVACLERSQKRPVEHQGGEYVRKDGERRKKRPFCSGVRKS